jgi:single-stranded-DNA-specific exonuclease
VRLNVFYLNFSVFARTHHRHFSQRALYFATMHTKRWLIAPPLTPQADSNLRNYPPILRQILFNRGYASEAQAAAFLKADTDFDTHPFQMTDMQVSVERIRHAIARHEPIAIYGDYDVDGVTATALLVQTLRALGADVRPYIPNRFDEGYGLNPEALDSLKEDGIKLVISVDCGIRSPDEAAHARTLGLDLIITDHHHPAEDLPPAFAILNPKRPGDTYPDKDLAGVGVAYKLAEALLLDGKPRTAERLPFLEGLLDLVALGTVADLAPLTGENRALVRRGLEQMRSTQRQGLFSLANVAGLYLSRVDATDIGFVLGPRLNAAGRLDSALAAYELLTTTDVQRAGVLAQSLDRQNRERQALTQQIQEQAEALARAGDPNALLLFAVHPEFNPGVVGLAASRLVEVYYRPAIVGQAGEETVRCSCRSIPELHITDALDECADLLVRHGGHAAAAGFTVRAENLERLKARLLEIARRELGDRDLRPTLNADLEVPLSAMHPDLLYHLTRLQPTGYGNPEPVFVSRDVQVKSARQVGADGKHLKMTVSDGRITFDAIGFRLGHLYEGLPSRVDLMYTFETNEYNGRVTLQLNLRDLKPTGIPD